MHIHLPAKMEYKIEDFSAILNCILVGFTVLNKCNCPSKKKCESKIGSDQIQFHIGEVFNSALIIV